MAADPADGDLSVVRVCDLFLDHARRHSDARTYRWYRDYLQDFCRHVPRLKVADLKPFHVTRWLDAHPGWGASRRNAVIAVKRPFNWAAKEGLIPASPVRAVKKPPGRSRARTLTREGRAELLAAIPDRQFREFVLAMQETGCRPSEVARVEAADCNLDLGVWVLHRHKTGGKTGKPRVVYLTRAVVDLSRRLAAEHPEGPLFRGPRSGRPFGMHGICSRFRRLREKLPHLRDAIAYAYRHSFATAALTRGVGVAQVAELLGHRDTAMVGRHYGHLADQVDHLRAAAAKAAGG